MSYLDEATMKALQRQNGRKALFLEHKGVRLYRVYKHVWPLEFWFSTDHRAIAAEPPLAREGDHALHVDVRTLPEAFLSGLCIQMSKALPALPWDVVQEATAGISALERASARAAFRRAIDADFDFQAHTASLRERWEREEADRRAADKADAERMDAKISAGEPVCEGCERGCYECVPF